MTTTAEEDALARRTGATGEGEEDQLAWLALVLSPGLGTKQILDAMKVLETPSQILGMRLTELEGLRFPAAAASENSGTRVTARCAAEQDRDLYAVPGNVTNKGSWTPNTLIRQGAKLVATWEDVWEDLPSQVRLELESLAPDESQTGTMASLLPDPVLRPQEGMVLDVLRKDASLQIDEILDRLETQLTYY